MKRPEKSETIGLRVSAQERKELEKMASAIGLSTSGYIMLVLNGAWYAMGTFQNNQKFETALSYIEREAQGLIGRRRATKVKTSSITVRMTQKDAGILNNNAEVLNLSQKEYILLVHFIAVSILKNIQGSGGVLDLFSKSIRDGTDTFLKNLKINLEGQKKRRGITQ